MKEDRKDSEMNKEDLFPWSALAKVAAAVVAVGGIAIHFMGLVGHMSYLRAWGVDAGLFPKPIDWLMTNGAAALVDRTVVALAAATTITGRLLLIALLCFVFSSIAFRIGIAGDSPARPITKPKACSPNPWTRSLGFGVLVTLSVFGAVPIAMFFVAALILFPWVMGRPTAPPRRNGSARFLIAAAKRHQLATAASSSGKATSF